MLHYIYPVLIVSTLLVGLFNREKIKGKIIFSLLYFLFFSVLVEVSGPLISKFLDIKSFFVYNTYFLVSILFYNYLFKAYLTSKKTKKTLNLLTIGYVLFIVLNHFLMQDYYHSFQTNSAIYSGIFAIIAVGAYYFESLNSDKVLYAKKSLLFWVSLGLLLFQIGIIPIYIFAEYLNFSGIFDYILLTLNFILYGCMMIGFVVSERAHN
ncbi:MAG: hypothetical protein COB60_09100 [Flavobacteriaceae bacterium]|nr:MAG: hypothetical protein COB60_09100 [Flavobacteriaceae bacterium]